MHRFVKAVGSGQKRARDLTRDEAREAMTLICEGRAEPAQIGAFLIALRMKGECADELAGFVDALGPQLRRGSAPSGTLDVDCHGDGHAGRPSLLPAAACAAAALGVPVLLRIEQANPWAKHGLTGALASLGFDGVLDASRAERDLERRQLGVVDLAQTCPPLHALIALRRLLGVRTVAQTLAKLIDPMRASARLVGVFHAPYLPATARALAAVATTPGVCAQALGGLPEASAGKIVRIATTSEPEPTTLDLRSLGAAPSPPAVDEDAPALDATEAAVAENRAALAGEEPALGRAAAACALLLYAARGTPIADGAADARRALGDGRARAIIA